MRINLCINVIIVYGTIEKKCDCPSQMKARACKRALKDKESFEKSKQSQNDK